LDRSRLLLPQHPAARKRRCPAPARARVDRAPGRWRALALGDVIHAREPGVVSCAWPGCMGSRPAASQHWRSGIPYAIWRVAVEHATSISATRHASQAHLVSSAPACGRDLAWGAVIGSKGSNSATILQQYSLVELPL